MVNSERSWIYKSSLHLFPSQDIYSFSPSVLFEAQKRQWEELY